MEVYILNIIQLCLFFKMNKFRNKYMYLLNNFYLWLVNNF